MALHSAIENLAIAAFAVILGVTAIAEAVRGYFTKSRVTGGGRVQGNWYLRLFSALGGLVFITFGIFQLFMILGSKVAH